MTGHKIQYRVGSTGYSVPYNTWLVYRIHRIQRIQDAGYRILDTGYTAQDTEYWIKLPAGYRIQDHIITRRIEPTQTEIWNFALGVCVVNGS